MKKTQGAPVGNENAGKQTGQNVHFVSPNTATTLTAQHGVTERSIRRDGETAEVILERPVTGQALLKWSYRRLCVKGTHFKCDPSKLL
jgi:hypothetical protein